MHFDQIKSFVEQFSLLRLKSAIEEKIATPDDLAEILVQAIILRRLDVLDAMLDGGLVDINVRNRVGLTLLEVAIETSDEKVISHILDKGANVNECGSTGLTPLHLAIDIEMEIALHQIDTTGKKVDPVAKVSALLLERGADKKAKCINGETPLEFAQERGHAAAVSLLQ